MPFYRTKPNIKEAMQYTGNNATAVLLWAGVAEVEEEFLGGLTITTLEGKMHASPGDYIIKGLIGEFYPCKPDVFEKSYDEEA
jgi:hypothetical protein